MARAQRKLNEAEYLAYRGRIDITVMEAYDWVCSAKGYRIETRYEL